MTSVHCLPDTHHRRSDHGGVVAALISTRFPTGLSFVLVIVSTIVLINGFNLIDGLDALCGSVTLICAIGFAIVMADDGRLIAVALAGAIAAFLVFNRPPARIYLGDGGSYLIGTTAVDTSGAVLESSAEVIDRNCVAAPRGHALRRAGAGDHSTSRAGSFAPRRRPRSSLRPVVAQGLDPDGGSPGLRSRGVLPRGRRRCGKQARNCHSHW